MSKPIRPLIDVVAEIPDVRQARGKRHPLSRGVAAELCSDAVWVPQLRSHC